MDLDKFTIFLKSFGFPAMVAIWFMWKIQAYLDAMTMSQTQIVELLRQLIIMHQR